MFSSLLPKHTSDAKDLEEASSRKVKLAIQLSFIANILLAILQVYAAASSLSLSLFAVSLAGAGDCWDLR